MRDVFTIQCNTVSHRLGANLESAPNHAALIRLWKFVFTVSKSEAEKDSHYTDDIVKLIFLKKGFGILIEIHWNVFPRNNSCHASFYYDSYQATRHYLDRWCLVYLRINWSWWFEAHSYNHVCSIMILNTIRRLVTSFYIPVALDRRRQHFCGPINTSAR